MEKKDRIIGGCMRLSGQSQQAADRFLSHALDVGVRWFNHADIYAGGDCERVFGAWLKAAPGRREKVVIQSKCGIVPGVCYDSSRDHILTSVDGILERLGTDHLDVLLLHRPDALMEPEEVAEAFDRLYAHGKVLRFGVSNFSAKRIKLLQKYLDQKLEFDQVQFGPAHAGLVRFGLAANNAGEADGDGELLDWCMLHGVGLQAWSPLQYGMIEGCFLNEPGFAQLAAKLAEIGAAYGLSPAATAIAWVLRHPAGFQVITGTMNEAHLDDLMAAQTIRLTRGEWYDIYRAAGNPQP